MLLKPYILHDDNPTLVSFGGGSLGVKEIESRMTEAERNENSPEYKKIIAMNMIRERVLNELAAKENLSQAAYIEKIKSGADTKVSDEEFDRFLKERNFDRKKLSKPQLENILANIKAQKREVFF